MAVVTFSRQFGSGGDEIAARVGELLHYRYFDKQLMLQVASEMGLCHDGILDLSEDRFEVRHFLSRLFQAGPRIKVWGTDEAGQYTLSDQELNADRCIDLIKQTIQAVYEQGYTIIVGRGGQAILHDQPDVLHVRVVAPLKDRIARLRDQGVRGIAEIKLAINQHDKATAEYLKRFYDINWNDASLYHLVVNTGKMTIENASQLIVTAVKQIQSEPATT